MGALREAFSRGHDRLVERLLAAISALEAGVDHEKTLVLIAFVRQVRAHVHCEESVVFPTLDLAVPALRHLTLTLRREHEAFCRILTDVEERVRQGDLAAAAADLRELAAALELHERRESAELCPLVEACTSGREVEDLVAALSAPG